METITAISSRRSIRKYQAAPIPHNDIEKIILAGMQAPSPKNRQPWRFAVIEGGAKADMISAMIKGLEREVTYPKLLESSIHISGAKYSISVMEQAPVTIFVINPLNMMERFPVDWEARFGDISNVQSVGACIQNMLLAATDLGYGSLWINDIYFAYEEIGKWLNTNKQIVAAVSFGIPAENPSARPRNNTADMVEWKNS